MSGLTSRLPRWRGRRSAAEPATGPAAPGPARDPRGPRTVLDEFGAASGPGGASGFLLRSSADRRTSVRELARSLRVERERPVVIVDVTPDAAGNLGEELGGLLARLRDEHRSAARLVMSGAAARKPDGQLPLAQRLADAWDFEIEAPDAAAVLVPGGGLYVTEPASPAGGWWRFAPGAEPVALGARIPAPRWQRALARVPLGELGDHTVRQIPAGLLLHPTGAAAPRPGDLAFALAVHPDRLTVLVNGADSRNDLAEDLATLLARLAGGTAGPGAAGPRRRTRSAARRPARGGPARHRSGGLHGPPALRAEPLGRYAPGAGTAGLGRGREHLARAARRGELRPGGDGSGSGDGSPASGAVAAARRRGPARIRNPPWGACPADRTWSRCGPDCGWAPPPTPRRPYATGPPRPERCGSRWRTRTATDRPGAPC